MSDLPNLVMITTATDESVGGAPASECGAQRAGCDAECAPTDSSVAVATITKLGNLHPPSVHRPSMKVFCTSQKKNSCPKKKVLNFNNVTFGTPYGAAENVSGKF
ncbi:hypothetical protein C8R45DRAFT_944592 [Mycena sanguinolenta]|nr:hypothetical protein C8R45DRAFT_944592 [Mycena sanguinolenta]